MTGNTLHKEKLIFGLDIGTRSIVGTVGSKDGNKFIVVAQRSKEHETRAMLDGQIHDIHRVGETIREVKEMLSDMIEREREEKRISGREYMTADDDGFDDELDGIL